MTTEIKIAVGIYVAKNMAREIYMKKLLRRYREVKNLNEVYDAELVYLCDLINRNEIRLDEFDLIALPTIKHKSS
jgi:hypothetical protein